MRIEYKEEKDPAIQEEPIIHESDLTAKEKRQIEWEKVKGMSWQNKLVHFWTYYKAWLLLPVLLIVIVVTAVQMYQNAQVNQILYVNISEVALDTDESLAKLSSDLLELCRVEDGGSHQQVSVTNNMISSEEYNSSVLMSVWLSTGEMDLVLTDEETYQRYSEQEIFVNIEDEFPEAYARLKEHMQGNVVYLDTSVWEDYHLVEYEPVAAGILITATHKEAAVEALLYLCGEQE